MLSLEALACDLRRLIRGSVGVGIPLARHTTWRIGGPADLLVTPVAEEEVLACRLFASRHGLPFTVLGNGSNLLVSDLGVRGLVLRTAGGLKGVSWRADGVVAEAGVSLAILGSMAARKGLAGLEPLAGIPATLGGASVVNAGAEGTSLGDLLKRLKTLEADGSTRMHRVEELGYAYRHSLLKGRPSVVLEAELALRPADPREVRVRRAEALRRRRVKQPLSQPSAGSVFVNPPGKAAGQLIEEAGAKGLSRGGAMVSDKHANFMINRGRATANEVLALIEEVRERVWLKAGVALQLEIQLLGEGLEGRG